MRPKKIFLVVCLLAVAETAKMGAQVISSDRTINWIPGVTVGVRGGIPVPRSSIIDVTQAPYNADNTGGTSAAAAIQAAINAATSGQVVYCPAGTYDITAGITITQNNITFRGAGSNTVLVGSISVGLDPNGNYPAGSGFYVSSGANKLSTNLTFVGTKDVFGNTLGVGDALEISSVITGNSSFQYIKSQGGEPEANRENSLRQAVLITSMSGNSCTITPPLIWDFTNTPSVGPLNLVAYAPLQMKTGIGLENFTLTTTNGTLNSTPPFMLKLSMLHDCWVTGCNFFYGQNYNVYFEYCIDCSFAHNQVRYAKSSGSNHAGLVAANDSGCLIEDNVLADGLQPGMEWNDGFCGNAIFANFFTNNIIDIDMHNTHPAMDLWEENVTSGYELDGYFGSCSHQTLFRNRIYGTTALKRWSTYVQVVGNVLGNPSYPYIYCPSNSNYPIYGVLEIGYPNIGNSTYSAVSGPVPWNYPGTFLVGGLGESVTNGVFVINKTQINTNVITGIFTNVPSANVSQYALIGQDPVNTNVYYAIGTPAAAPTASSIKLAANTSVTNGWRVFIANQSSFQWLQTSNILTDIITGNAVCTNQSSYTTVWDANGAQSIPSSLLYSSAPPYWTTNYWPAIDPLTNPVAVNIPAQTAYYFGFPAVISTNVAITFSANPTSVINGGTTTLTWATANATNVTISGIGPVDPAGGSTNVTQTGRTTYTAIANGPSGSVTNSVTVGLMLRPPTLENIK